MVNIPFNFVRQTKASQIGDAGLLTDRLHGRSSQGSRVSLDTHGVSPLITRLLKPLTGINDQVVTADFSVVTCNITLHLAKSY